MFIEPIVCSTRSLVLRYIAMCLSIASVAFGLVSWCALPKWRQFRHYAFLNVLLPLVLNWGLQPTLLHALDPYLLRHVELCAILCYLHWLMVVTLMFYIEFVQVFTSLEAITHLYLKATVFGWVLPIALSTLSLLHSYAMMALVLEYLLLININFVVYLCVLYALWRRARMPAAERGADIGKKVMLSTFAFMGNGITFLVINYIESTTRNHGVGPTLFHITTCSINVFFLMLKFHRQLWREYWARKYAISSSLASVV